jgi:hypothetical protein
MGFLLGYADVLAGPPQYPHNRWMLGVDLVGNDLGEADDLDNLYIDSHGTGGAFQAGFLLSPRFQLRLYTSGAEHQTSLQGAQLYATGASLEVAYLFRPFTSFRPYVNGGLGGFRLESRQTNLEYRTDGGGFIFGGGAHWYLGKVVAIHFSARLEAVNWDSQRASLILPSGESVVFEAPFDESGGMGKLTLGLSFWI